MTPYKPEAFFEIVPHRPPMVWIDLVTEYGDGLGTAITRVTEGALFMTGGKVHESAHIELIAQAFAYSNAAQLTHNHGEATPKKRAFLAAVKDFEIVTDVEIPLGAEIRTVVQRDRQFGPITMIQGQTYWNDILLAKGELKVFAD